MWTDLRIIREDVGHAVAVLASEDATHVRIDFNPPAAGPEVELSVHTTNEQGIVRLLRAGGITVLASRLRGWDR